MLKSEIKRFGSGMHYIELQPKIAETFIDSGTKRVICLINKSYELHCAIMRTKEGLYYLTVGNRILKELKLKSGQVIHIELKEDNSELQFYMPEEFKEVIETDEQAFLIFNSLTDGNKRGLISLVMQVKSVDKKIERALMIAKKLKNGITSPQKILSK